MLGSSFLFHTKNAVLLVNRYLSTQPKTGFWSGECSFRRIGDLILFNESYLV